MSLEDLGRSLQRIRVGLRDEADTQPGQQRIYGRLHDGGRARNLPRFTQTGVALRERTHIRADCDRPSHGRCTHPDGSWRPVPGVQRADAMARDTDYELDRSVMLVYCLYPWRRAMKRLYDEGDNHRRHDVLRRLLEGYSVASAWMGLGSPPDPLASALRIVVEVETMAKDEAWTSREVVPKHERSESQANAEEAGSAVA